MTCRCCGILSEVMVAELPRLGSLAERARVVPVLFGPSHVDALELWQTGSRATFAELMAAWHASFFRCPSHAPGGHPLRCTPPWYDAGGAVPGLWVMGHMLRDQSSSIYGAVVEVEAVILFLC